MISVRFQVFFIDPSAERPQMLCAVSPMFTTPSSIETLVQTARYEKRIPVVFSGTEDLLIKLIKQAERFDIDDWLDFEPEKIEQALKTLGESLGNHYFDLSRNERNKDPVTAKVKMPKYPIDLPSKNKAIWDEVQSANADYLRKFKIVDEKMAAIRKLYTSLMAGRGQVPWTSSSNSSPDAKKKEIIDSLTRGYKKWEDLLKVFERHLTASAI